MSDPEVREIARFLATHAVVLLGLALVAAVASTAVILWAVRLAIGFRPRARRAIASFSNRLRQIESVRHALGRVHPFVPSAYLALHLALGLLVAVAIAMFAALAEEVLAAGELAAFDLAFAQALHDTSRASWRHTFAVVSSLGTREALTGATVVVTGALLIRRERLAAAGWIAAQAGGGLLNRGLKEAFARARPEFADPVLAESSWSFPSGHAMGTFILFGVGSYLLVRNTRSWTTAVVAVTLSVSWCAVMAFSRLYLGVHYASDVVAGLLAGVAWVAVCVSALEVLRRRTGGVRRV